jgi:hypothetical protein
MPRAGDDEKRVKPVAAQPGEGLQQRYTAAKSWLALGVGAYRQ